MADKIVVLNAGKVEQIGSPLELYDRPVNMFVAGFLGSPAMNFLQGTVLAGSHSGIVLADGSVIQLDAVPATAGETVVLGVRPEDMRIANGDASDLAVDATVEVVERLGSEILLDVAVGPTTMVASVEPTATAKVHEKLRLALNPDRLHFFDGETEAAI